MSALPQTSTCLHMFKFFLLAVGVVACTLNIASAEADSVLETRSSSPHVLIFDAVTGYPIADCSVSMVGVAGGFIKTTDSYGYAVFSDMQLTDTMPEPEFGFQKQVTITIQHPGYVPFSGVRATGDFGLGAQVGLISKSSGSTTPIIDAQEGGRFKIPSVGTMIVPPGTAGGILSTLRPLSAASGPFLT